MVIEVLMMMAMVDIGPDKEAEEKKFFYSSVRKVFCTFAHYYLVKV